MYMRRAYVKSFQEDGRWKEDYLVPAELLALFYSVSKFSGLQNPDEACIHLHIRGTSQLPT